MLRHGAQAPDSQGAKASAKQCSAHTPAFHRRDFLKLSGAAGASMALGPDVLAWIGSSRRTRGNERKTLVLVELTGGNDGLNTVVPWANDAYHRARPTLRIDPSRVHKLDDAVGFAPELRASARLFKDGKIVVAQGVGMQHPDRSHFTSLDRWHSGDVANDARLAGWVGRGLDGMKVDPAGLAGIAIRERSVPRLLQHDGRQALCCEVLDDLVPSERARQVLASPALKRMDGVAGTADDRRLAALSTSIMTRLEKIASQSITADAFPETALGRGLGDALRIILGDLDLRAIFVRKTGFDTHVRQGQVQPALLAELDGALHAFISALVRRELAEHVMVVVYSEFGRRVAENGSAGTDHGSAAPVLLLGGGIEGHILGSPPDLGDLDDGDVRATVDFRRVLAQGLKHLGHPAPADVLGATPLF